MFLFLFIDLSVIYSFVWFWMGIPRKYPVHVWVPESSIPDPIVFLLYINDFTGGVYFKSLLFELNLNLNWIRLNLPPFSWKTVHRGKLGKLSLFNLIVQINLVLYLFKIWLSLFLKFSVGTLIFSVDDIFGMLLVNVTWICLLRWRNFYLKHSSGGVL